MQGKASFKVLLIVLLAGIGVAFSACHMPVVDNKDVERAKETPLLFYQHLTTESSHPYARGKPALLDEYRLEASKAYPTVRDYLVKSERFSDNPDLRLIDWKNIRKRPELEICLWRIFSSLEDFNVIMKWMDFHYIEWGRQQKPSSLKYKDLRDRVNIDGTHVTGRSFYWQDKLPFRDKAPVPRLFTDRFQIFVVFDQSDKKIITLWVKWLQSM